MRKIGKCFREEKEYAKTQKNAYDEKEDVLT